MRDYLNKLPWPTRVVLFLVLLLAMVLNPFSDVNRNASRAKELMTGFCGDNEECLEKGKEHLKECIAANSRHVKKSTEFDEDGFSVCIRGHLGLGWQPQP